MKIALLTATFSQYSGIDRVVEQQARKLLSEGNQVTIVTFEVRLKVPGAMILEVKMPQNLFLQRLYRLLFFLQVKKIKETASAIHDVDQVISHQYPMNLIAYQVKKENNAHYICYNHGIAPLSTFSNFFEKAYICIITWLTNNSIKKADKVISVSNYLSEVLERETGVKGTVTKELFSVDTKRFNLSVKGDTVRKKYNLADNPIVLYVGRISPHKGIELLIQAFNKVLDIQPEARLIIAGKQTFAQYQKKLNRISNSSVIFAGFVSDDELPYYYAACTVYATATLWEGFDLPIVEAQACGKPVVAFNLCSHPEVVNENGILVNPGDVNEFSEAILKKI